MAWEASQNAGVFISVGTSGVVQPAASLASVARDAGAFLVEVNPEETEVSYMFDEVLRHPSGVALPALGERLGIARD
jgi:NAD-dependent deacetylase